MNYSIIRLANPYGPYQRPNGRLGAVTTFVYKAMNDELITVYGDGSVVRDYIYIDDAIAAIINIACSNNLERIYNVGSGVGISINQLLRIISSVLNKPLKVEYSDKRLVDVPINYLDISRYEKEYGRLNNVSLEEGIRATELFMRLK